MQKLCVINVVGLSPSLLPHAPNISALGPCTTLEPVLPAVTCSAQSSMLTGKPVSEHGIVGNGWFNHEQQTIDFWKQSNKLVQGPKVWDTAKQRAEARGETFTSCNMFWWYNMHSTADFSVTPRPQYKADGRKLPDVYSHPASLRDELQQPAPQGLGTFPLFRFWGPLSDITSSQWIADATQRVVAKHDPTLTLVYLPHLDYPLQKLGPNHADIPGHVKQIDNLVGNLADFMQQHGRKVLVVSEYGIEPVHEAIFVNKILRQAGLLAIREESGIELLDAGASQAFAVADHQVAHVYHDPSVTLPPIPNCTATTIDHPRAGHTVLVADEGFWFTYDYWDDARKAPDFARTVDIHRKPGYDPRELFTDKSNAQIAWRLLKKKLGFRQLMDVIPLDTSLVQGSHGRTAVTDAYKPILITPPKGESTAPTPGGECTRTTSRPMTDIHDVILQHLVL